MNANAKRFAICWLVAAFLLCLVYGARSRVAKADVEPLPHPTKATDVVPTQLGGSVSYACNNSMCCCAASYIVPTGFMTCKMTN